MSELSILEFMKSTADVNVVVNYKYQGSKYQMLIPANSAEKMSILFGTSKFCGFRNMSSIFATTNE